MGNISNVCCEGPNISAIQPKTLPFAVMFEPSLSPKINNDYVRERINDLKSDPLHIDQSHYQGVQIKPPMKEINRNFVYEGTWKQDKPEGKGTIVFENGEYFQGQFKNGKACGKGRFIFFNGDYFEGQIEDNEAKGEGKYIGQLVEYTGEWMNSRPTIGTYTIKKNQTTITMRDEKSGEILWTNGNRYQGQIKHQLPQGNGRMTFKDGSFYDGPWKNGMFQGYGTFRWPSGKAYKGHYVNGIKEGRGVFEYSESRRYEGDWKGGKQNGFGKLYENSILVYEGEFVNGAPAQRNSSMVLPSNLESQLKPPHKLQFEPRNMTQSQFLSSL